MNTHAPSPNRSASRDALRAQIQEAWTQHHDIDLPLQLAYENPDLADDLLNFFDVLVSAEVTQPTNDEQNEAARRLTDRLRKTGKSDLADAVDRVRSCGSDETSNPTGNSGFPESGSTGSASPHLTLVSQPDTTSNQVETRDIASCKDYYDYAASYDYDPDDIAQAFGLPLATSHKLVINSTECPPPVQRHMARLGADNLPRTDYSTGLRHIEGGQSTPVFRQRAASRTSGYEGERAFSYRAVFEDAPSSLSEKTRQLWLSLAEGSEPASQ